MAISTRIDPISRDISLMISDALGPQARSAMLADFARRQIADAAAANAAALGREPPHTTFVDGREGAPLASVKPEGTIVTVFDLMDDLFEWIGDMLVQNSPVLTGRYAASHVFFADGVEVEPGAAVPPASEYVFLNTQPYARKIERGLSPQAPDGVYEVVAAMASRRFGNVASISFSFRFVPAGAVGDWARSTRLQGRDWSADVRKRVSKLTGHKRTDYLTRQPAIVITPHGVR